MAIFFAVHSVATLVDNYKWVNHPDVLEVKRQDVLEVKRQAAKQKVIQSIAIFILLGGGIAAVHVLSALGLAGIGPMHSISLGGKIATIAVFAAVDIMLIGYFFIKWARNRSNDKNAEMIITPPAWKEGSSIGERRGSLADFFRKL